MDRRRSLRREDLDELAVRRFVGGLPDVLRMLLGRVVVAESRLYAPLRLRRVAGLQRTLRRHGDPDAGSSSGDRCSEAGRAAADHEHIEGRVRHEFGDGLKQVIENEAGDFIYIKPGVPHEVFNMSDTEPVVAFVARSSADEWDNIVPYERDQR